MLQTLERGEIHPSFVLQLSLKAKSFIFLNLIFFSVWRSEFCLNYLVIFAFDYSVWSQVVRCQRLLVRRHDCLSPQISSHSCFYCSSCCAMEKASWSLSALSVTSWIHCLRTHWRICTNNRAFLVVAWALGPRNANVSAAQYVPCCVKASQYSDTMQWRGVSL